MDLFRSIVTQLQEFLLSTGMSEDLAVFIRTTIVVVSITGLAILADIIAKRIILRIILKIIKSTKTKWDDLLISRKTFNRLSHIVPAIIIWTSASFMFSDYDTAETVVEHAAQIYMIIVILLVVDSVINVLHEIYRNLPISEGRNIKGYVQVVKIIVYFVATIFILAVLLGQTPKGLLTGLGAMAAVLILVFRDTILGLVASVQMSGNKMVSVGDWIEMPKFGADGTVLDISLNTVKVQNWDKTIVTIPTYAMVSESFTNWKGMEESGGRRIKRSVNIDMTSVKFCDKEMIERFRKIHRLKDYIEKKQAEIEEYNKRLGIDETVLVNGRRMTNFGTFRNYVKQYLMHHPMIHQDMTFLVRHLQPSDKGIPLEIYVFCKDQAWANYEAIMADIFDHILAVIPEFDLRVFQSPSGKDFQYLKQ